MQLYTDGRWLFIGQAHCRRKIFLGSIIVMSGQASRGAGGSVGQPPDSDDSASLTSYCCLHSGQLQASKICYGKPQPRQCLLHPCLAPAAAAVQPVSRCGGPECTAASAPWPPPPAAAAERSVNKKYFRWPFLGQ